MTTHGFIADTLNEFEFNHTISQQLHHVPRVLHDVQDSRSFGASLHAKAISAASCVASSFEAAPGRGRSCKAASSPSSEQRFRMLPTVDAEVLRAVQISASCLPWSSLRRILALVMTRALCVPERVIWLSVVRSVSVSWIGYFLRLTARVFMLSD